MVLILLLGLLMNCTMIFSINIITLTKKKSHVILYIWTLDKSCFMFIRILNHFDLFYNRLSTIALKFEPMCDFGHIVFFFHRLSNIFSMSKSQIATYTKKIYIFINYMYLYDLKMISNKDDRRIINLNLSKIFQI